MARYREILRLIQGKTTFRRFPNIRQVYE